MTEFVCEEYCPLGCDVVWLKFADVSKKHDASVFTVEYIIMEAAGLSENSVHRATRRQEPEESVLNRSVRYVCPRGNLMCCVRPGRKQRRAKRCAYSILVFSHNICNDLSKKTVKTLHNIKGKEKVQ